MPDELDVKSTVEAYLSAFQARDPDRCLAYFAEAATLDFQRDVFQGHQAIAEWHRARWTANLAIVSIESMSICASVAVVDLIVTSDRLRAWKLERLSARATLKFEGGVVTAAEFSARLPNPIAMITGSIRPPSAPLADTPPVAVPPPESK